MQESKSRWLRPMLAAAAGTVVLWFIVNAVAAAWGPSPETIAQGRKLFLHEWKVDDPLAGEGDGLGPVFNARSCVACHFQGGPGGAGPNQFNVAAFEVHPTSPNAPVRAGVVHAAAVRADLRESRANVARLFPTIENGTRIVDGCSISIVDFNPVQFFEMNTPALFGSGLVERISDGSITRARNLRALKTIGKEFELDFSSTPVGRPHVLPDGRIGKFGWKAQFATLEEFVAAACAGEIGLTNPLASQHVPLKHEEDPNAEDDLNSDQFDALVAFVDTLDRPIQVLPEDADGLTRVRRGEHLFTSIGCADCHTPELGGVEGLYSDLLLHRMEDADSGGYGAFSNPEIPLPESHPRADEWKTAPLWGIADSAPYYHDGGSPTLHAAIIRHAGEARRVRERYVELSREDRIAIVAFLKTLKAPPASESESAGPIEVAER